MAATQGTLLLSLVVGTQGSVTFQRKSAPTELEVSLHLCCHTAAGNILSIRRAVQQCMGLYIQSVVWAVLMTQRAGTRHSAQKER